MKKKYLFLLLVLFVLLDLSYTFFQAYQLPLEGDLPSIVLPGPECQQILHDPFGWAVLTRNEVYVAPNRFFAHAAMVSYFKSVPFALQRFIDPISSVYAACALFAVGVQALLLYVLGVYITGSYRLNHLNNWLAMALLAPLFQIAGYNDQMGILDHSITYTFFYAFPMTLLLLLLLPFFLAASKGQPLQLSWPRCIALVGLMVVLAFNGAIITGVVAVLFFGIGLHWVIKQWQTSGGFRPAQWVRQIPRLPAILLGLFTVLCLYSLYIGLNEKESVGHVMPLWERYTRIPSGLFWQFRKLGLPLLVIAIGINAFFISRKLPSTPESQRILLILKWLGLFALIYLLLLPLGGYRQYRPLIVRRDSILPIILGGIAFYGLSTYFLLYHLPAQVRRWYILGVGVFAAIYINADSLKLPAPENNTCERQGLERLAAATEPIVRVSAECSVMAWWKIDNPNYSETNAQLLEYWGITQGKKLYYHQGW
ncbi:hypothetical protein J0X19_10635 [Hymenobacter sp. BT186]|uniref:Uncharacterized protein n=1 Tax=Hymenobacter telluris TaxID=2816474 RepID=A0A939EXG8_9BACT|nr:hypothetical protein [Hymenobacter telluris]MBO0358402.1 hypothetical protein [Hymenobacter telluris]MBW3374428.1 hypothetical protein [Hymenobacter norwichensis]